EGGVRASSAWFSTRLSRVRALDLLRAAGQGTKADEAHPPLADLGQEPSTLGRAREEPGIDEDDVEGLDEDRGHAQPVLAGGGQVDEMIEIDAQVRDGGHRWFA